VVLLVEYNINIYSWQGKVFSSASMTSLALEDSLHSIQCLPCVRHPVNDADQSLPSSSEDKKEWRDMLFME
jgi:hypothetical protein